MEEFFGLYVVQTQLCLKIFVLLACPVPWVNQVIAENSDLLWD